MTTEITLDHDTKTTNETSDLNKEISDIIRSNKLDRKQNNFFNKANYCKEVSIESALFIAYNWYEITKTFMFTSVKGLAPLIEKIMENPYPSKNQLYVLQTVLSVISDDINNVHPAFKKVAPQGVDGIHYRWWQNSILEKLQNLTRITPILSDGTRFLSKKMKKFALTPMGTAVQLRVVEAIAFDIASAFLAVFNKVENGSEKVFKEEKDALWITAHIQAESIHNEKVCDEVSGMAKIVESSQEKKEMLDMVNEYCKAWAAALEDFAALLL